MYKLMVKGNFAAAHQLREFQGKCEHLHGHNWKVEVYITGEKVGEDGMLMDFGLIKKATAEVLDRLDHQFLNEVEPFTSLNPSSENIARYIYESLGREINNGNARVSKVTAWESDTACATYMET